MTLSSSKTIKKILLSFRALLYADISENMVVAILVIMSLAIKIDCLFPHSHRKENILFLHSI
jgi:hypothetical protein